MLQAEDQDPPPAAREKLKTLFFVGRVGLISTTPLLAERRLGEMMREQKETVGLAPLFYRHFGVGSEEPSGGGSDGRLRHLRMY